jgi:hypothetical protein
MNCQIEYSLNGQRGRVEVEAPTSIDGLLQWLATVPQTSAVKAIVRVLVPINV